MPKPKIRRKRTSGKRVLNVAQRSSSTRCVASNSIALYERFSQAFKLDGDNGQFEAAVKNLYKDDQYSARQGCGN